MHGRLLLLAASSVLTSQASAQLMIPTAQERRIEAIAILGLGGGPMESELHEATDFSPFNEVAMARVEDISQGILADAGAWQNSQIQSDRIQVEGSYNATVEFFFTEAESRNLCRFEFTVPQDCLYDLSGRLEAYDFGSTQVSWYALGGATIFGSAALGFSTSNTFDHSGFLPAGDYIFEVIGGAFLQDGSPYEYASGSYEFDIQLRSPGSTDCVPTAGSSGLPVALALTGTHQVGSQTYYVVTQGPPGQFGVLFYGVAEAPTPFGGGVLCVASPQYRLPGVKQFDASGALNGSLSWSAPPLGQGAGQVVPGSTWTFQFWFRDVLTGSSTWNTSSAFTATFE